MNIIIPVAVFVIMLIFEAIWEALPTETSEERPNQVFQTVLKVILVGLLILGFYHFQPMHGQHFIFILSFVVLTMASVALELLYFGITNTGNSLNDVTRRMKSNQKMVRYFNRNDARWIVIILFSIGFSTLV